MIYDCVIIGSGVAGLTAGLYLGRANKSVMIIEDSVLGGTTATLDRIDNYPGMPSISGMELVQKLVSQVTSLGINIDFMHVNSIDFDNNLVVCDKNTIKYKSLIIASGTSYKKLNIPKENEFKFKGLSYCAICDGPLYKNKKILVVTDGFSAQSSIEYLSNISEDILVIDKSDRYNLPNKKVYHNSIVTQIIGEDRVEGVIVESSDKRHTIMCDVIFVALGKSSNIDLYSNKIHVRDGYIESDENMHTNIEGVFVAGDIRYKSLRQIITACADGAIAGTEAIKFIQSI